ncbi:hypothetical protein [Nonomuraea sp. NPDC049709]|uniref:hypothetical protein n=1 Tax=Nonomuraea sp. NPDC049709 TaxID=3154736 RepID=UPI00344A61D3
MTWANHIRRIGPAGDPAAACDQFAARLPTIERARGVDHPSTLAIRYFIAVWTGRAGNASGARDQLAALLPIRERILGVGHSDARATRRQLAFWVDEVG